MGQGVFPWTVRYSNGPPPPIATSGSVTVAMGSLVKYFANKGQGLVGGGLYTRGDIVSSPSIHLTNSFH